MLAAQAGHMIGGIGVGVAWDGVTAGAGFKFGFTGCDIACCVRTTGQEAEYG